MGDAVTAIAALVLAHRSAGARTIFSLPPHASVQECRARYKVLARALHPGVFKQHSGGAPLGVPLTPQRRQAGWRERRAAPLLRGGIQSYQRSSSQPGQRRGGPGRAAAGALGDALGSGGTAAAARRHGRGAAGAALYRRLYANPLSRNSGRLRGVAGAREAEPTRRRQPRL